MVVLTMPEMDSRILAAVLGAIITLVVSTVVLIFTNRGHNKRQALEHEHDLLLENRKHMREKLEQVYLAFSNWTTYFSSIYVGMIGYVKGDMSEESAFQLMRRGSSSGSNEQVEMLIALYYPHVQEKYDAVFRARGEIVKYFPPNPDLVGDLTGFYSAQEKFEKEAKELKLALKSEMDNL